MIPTETGANQTVLIRLFPPTVVGSLRFTSHLSNPIAIAVTSVVKVMDDFVPGVSDLIEGFGLWFLALICYRTAAEKVISHGRYTLAHCEFMTAGATNTPRASHFHRPRPWP